MKNKIIVAYLWSVVSILLLLPLYGIYPPLERFNQGPIIVAYYAGLLLSLAYLDMRDKLQVKAIVVGAIVSALLCVGIIAVFALILSFLHSPVLNRYGWIPMLVVSAPAIVMMRKWASAERHVETSGDDAPGKTRTRVWILGGALGFYLVGLYALHAFSVSKEEAHALKVAENKDVHYEVAGSEHFRERPEVSYPQLPKAAGGAEQFVPDGWKIERQQEGDLNQDDIPDLVLVLRQQEQRNTVENNSGSDVEPLGSPPRILAVAFSDNPPGSYHLALTNHTLIPVHLDDVLKDVSIKQGALHVIMGFISHDDSWQTKHTFRYQNNCFQLIGFDSDETLNSDESQPNREILSANFSTKKMSVQRGTADDDTLGPVEWRRLPEDSMRCIDEVEDDSIFSLLTSALEQDSSANQDGRPVDVLGLTH